MSWQHARGALGGQLLPPPEDGVAVSSHPPGWLGKRWRDLLERLPRDAADRLNRGRTYAKRGRLRDLTLAPGCASAEVFCSETFRPTLRIRTFSRQEWKAITRELASDLDLIASLLEGDLPEGLVERLQERDIRVVPTLEELGFDCDCGDYVMPCTHVTTVFHVLVDALDGDPFLLLTLRGRDREQLLSTLRSEWGDDAPLREVPDRVEEPPPEGDWLHAPLPLPAPAGHVPTQVAAGAGLRALGPPPGESSLLQTLQPLYESAHERVVDLLGSLPEREVRRRPRPMVPREQGPVDEEEPDEEAEDETLDPAVVSERIVALIAELEGATSTELSEQLGLSQTRVRSELVDLLALGMVYRRQEGPAVRWFLG
ncbi:MAG: hypothetical protein H6732_16785 [Alphaproteobacteria bacterium]|nr:hypothetical protein [Alphaproteobacteria bacterium]